MSKKISNFAADMKKTYYIPTMDIMRVNTRVMQLPGVTSDSTHSNAAPKRRVEVF